MLSVPPVTSLKVYNFTKTNFSKNTDLPVYPGGIEYTLQFKAKYFCPQRPGPMGDSTIYPYQFTDPVPAFTSVFVQDFNSTPAYIDARCQGGGSNSETYLKPCSGVSVNGFPNLPAAPQIWMNPPQPPSPAPSSK